MKYTIMDILIVYNKISGIVYFKVWNLGSVKILMI